MTMPDAGHDLRLASAEHKPLFNYLPVSVLGSAMGLTRLSIGWQAPAMVCPLSSAMGSTGALAVFGLPALAYGANVVTAWTSVLSEFRHPIAGNLFGTVLVGLLLLPFVLQPLNPFLAAAWMLGALAEALFPSPCSSSPNL